MRLNRINSAILFSVSLRLGLRFGSQMLRCCGTNAYPNLNRKDARVNGIM